MASTTKKSVFETLNAINVNEHTEKKNGLTYLSWAWAWAEAKKRYPDANYTVYETETGVNYFTDGRTCWVKTGVTIEGLEHIEYLPVMDYRNQSINAEKVTSFDVNKAIQRSLTKALARHGLGLYIYAGEDLPEDGTATASATTPAPAAKTPQKAAQRPVEAPQLVCEKCGGTIKNHGKNTAQQVATASKKLFGAMMCYDCAHETKLEREAKPEPETFQEDDQSGLPFPIED